MAQPSNRAELINYCKGQLGAPVLEINIADEQVEDLVDDALQYFHERHYDGVVQTYLKYKITQDDIDRSKSRTFKSMDYDTYKMIVPNTQVTPYEFEQLQKGNITEPGTYTV